MRRVILLMLAVIAVVAIPRLAAAQATVARPHLRAAAAAAKAHDWEKALDEYSAAFAADPTTTALEGVARSQYELHHDADAYDSYTKLAARGGRTAAHARARVTELGGKTALLTVAVKDPGAEVELDDQSLGSSPIEVTRRVSQGRHVVRAKPASGAPVEQTVDVAGGGTARVDLALPPPEKPKPPEPTAAAEGDAGAPPAPASTAPPAPKNPENAWDVPHGSKQYTAFRTDAPPKIDGELDDRVWQLAPHDTRFVDIHSKPYAQPVKNPTDVQIAYDDKNLYVAFRCQYAGPGQRDNSFPQDETGVAATSESVAVIVDALHNHTTAYAFFVSRAGGRADLEITDSGESINLDWRGIWDADVKRQGNDSWTVEFKIPWGTMRMPSHDGPFDVGIQLRRRDPASYESGVWAVTPPGSPYDMHYFAHLTGLRSVHPGQRLYLQPYISLAYESNPTITSSTTTPSPLTDFTMTQSNFRLYGGLYARYQPPGPFRLEGTFNPDFSAVTPDESTSNFDRFELAFPEARPFFAEDNPRFNFNAEAPYDRWGSFAAQMFYSRRIGYITDPRSGLTQVVPILWGAKAVLRTATTDLAVMNVGLAPPTPTLAVQDVITVARGRQSFGNGSYVGGIFLNRFGDVSRYAAGGPDALVTMFDRHLKISGFYNATWSDESTGGLGFSGGGSAAIQWNSEDFYADASYFDFGTNFDAQLGYVPITGIRADLFSMGYTPVLKNDLVQQLFFEAQFTHVTDRNDDRVYDRGVVSARADVASKAYVQVAIFPSAEHVAQPFAIGSCPGTDCSAAHNPVIVAAGDYTVNQIQAKVSTPPRRVVVGTLSYIDGDLFGGHRRAPSLDVQLNLGRFATEANYTLNLIHYNDQDFAAHVLNASATFFYTPLAKTTLAVTWSTLNENAVAQLVTSYTFGSLSTLSLVLRAASGSTATVDAIDWYDNPAFSAILQFALGLTPF